MASPNLTVEQVSDIVRVASEIQFLDSCGQKAVFTGIINGQKYALKFMRPNPRQLSGENEESLDDVTARAQREVETMQQCSSPHLVRMGPIGLTVGTINEEPIVYFSEEFIEGADLKRYLKLHGLFSVTDIITLALNISEAIDNIWQFAKIHRDIKPGNIMRRSTNGDFVLLDMGLVLDLQDESLSLGPVGTYLYFSPEQTDFLNRRAVMNFRSDLFSLGIVLYEMATGKHPFLLKSVSTSWDVVGNIINYVPPPPIVFRQDLPIKLNEIIVRLLAKRPALRYRSIALFRQALHDANPEGGTV